jgi:hypothetical protein
VDPIKSEEGIIIRYEKAGFDADKGDRILNDLNNQMANVNPIPIVKHNILSDTDGRLYPVLGDRG